MNNTSNNTTDNSSEEDTPECKPPVTLEKLIVDVPSDNIQPVIMRRNKEKKKHRGPVKNLFER